MIKIDKWFYMMVGSLAVFILTVVLNVYNRLVGLENLSLGLLIICPVVFVVGAVMFSLGMFKGK
jgi:hypothetical protein